MRIAPFASSLTIRATKPPNPALYPSSPRVTGGKAMTTARRWSIGKRAGRSPRRIKQTGEEKGRGIVNFRIEPAGTITVLAGNNTKREEKGYAASRLLRTAGSPPGTLRTAGGKSPAGERCSRPPSGKNGFNHTDGAAHSCGASLGRPGPPIPCPHRSDDGQGDQSRQEGRIL